MIKVIRKLAGVLVTGPIVGTLAYFLLNPIPMLAGAGAALLTGTGLSLVGATGAFSLALTAGLLSHITTGIYQTVMQYKDHQQQLTKAEAANPEICQKLREAPPAPITRGLLFGFSMANATAGRGNHPYGSKAAGVISTLKGLNVSTPRAR